MNDPFAIQQASVGAAREGMDAPDLQVRIAQLKAQQGQALDPEDLRRLGVRTGLEAEAARQDVSRGLTGDQTVFGPRTTSVYEGLAGTNLDPTLAQARVRSAQISSDPVLAARLAQEAELESIGMPRSIAGTIQGSDILANERIARQAALQTGMPIQEARAGQTPYRPAAAVDTSAFAPVLAPEAPAAAPVEGVAPKVKTMPQTRVSTKVRATIVPTVDPKQFSSYVRNESDREIANLGRVVSTVTAGRLRSEVAKNLAPVETEVSNIDDLTGHTYVAKVLKNSRGDVFSVGEPVLVKTNPITEAADKDFVKDYGEWSTTGAVTQASDAAMLRKIAQELPKLTMASGVIPGLITKFGIQDYVLPSKSTDTAETIRGIAQRGARAILGAAYTQKEGEDFMSRAFNPRLPAEVNAARADRMAAGLEKAAAAKQAKADYFEANGTTAGYRGPTYGLNELEKDVLGADGVTNAPKNAAAAQSLEDAKAKYLAAKKG